MTTNTYMNHILITPVRARFFRAEHHKDAPRGLRAFKGSRGFCRICFCVVNENDVRNLVSRGGKSVYLCVGCAGVW